MRGLTTLYEKKFSNLRPLLSITFSQGFQKSKRFGHWILESGAKKTFKLSEQIKKIRKKNLFCRCNFTLFLSKSFQIWDHFFQLLFPKDSQNLKSLDIELWKVGAKRSLNGVRKCNGQTNRKKQTDISTHRKNRPRGPILLLVNHLNCPAKK